MTALSGQKRIVTAEVDLALLGGPNTETDTQGANTDQQAQPEAPPARQEVTLSDEYVEQFKGRALGVARLAVNDSMLPVHIQDFVSPSIAISISRI